MKVFIVHDRLLIFMELSSLVCSMWSSEVSLLWRVNWTRWAYRHRLCPRFCEQFDEVSSNEGGLTVNSKKGGREVSVRTRELVSWAIHCGETG